jgi:uncharacterized protein YjbI with pentapeptide repeats
MTRSERQRSMQLARVRRRALTSRFKESDLPEIAAESNDLKAIRKAVEDAASVGGGLWLSYLFVLFYIAIAAGAVTHADLLLENPVKLPFLNVELPLKAFFFLAPLLFLITHAYTLAHLVLLADKAKRFHLQLREQIKDQGHEPESEDNKKAAEIRAGLRRQLPSNIFVQFLAGPDDVRESWFGVLLKVTAWATLVIGPVLLLLLSQIQFLPYHFGPITWTHRLALLADLLLVWWLWRKILSGQGDVRRWRRWAAASALGIASSFAALIFSWTVATFPGEWQEDLLPSFSVLPARWTSKEGPSGEPESASWISAHEWLFAGDVDVTTRRRKSLFSNTLVLPGFNIYEALKIDDPKKIEWREHSIDLRGRHLEGAVFDGASLPKADLSRAHLEGASLISARLQGAALEEAQLQGASLFFAQLQGASLDRAELQGARLQSAQLQGASLAAAQLQGASLLLAQLQGAAIPFVKAQGASLGFAQLQGASLDRAELQGVWLHGALLQGASLEYAQLQGASLFDPQPGAISIRSGSSEETLLSVARLNGISSPAELMATNLTNAFVWRAVFPKDAPKNLLAPDLNWLPEAPNYPKKSPWISSSYDALRRDMQNVVPEGVQRTDALKRIEILDCEKKSSELASCDPKSDPPASVTQRRRDIEKASVSEATYKKALAASLGRLLCDGDSNAIYVLRALSNYRKSSSNSRIEDTGTEAQALAARILSRDCPVSAALTEDDKAKLRAFQKPSSQVHSKR